MDDIRKAAAASFRIGVFAVFFCFLFFFCFYGADHNNSPLTGEGGVKKKNRRKITGWGCDGEQCWR